MARRQPRSRWRATRRRRRALALGLLIIATVGIARDLRPPVEQSVAVLVAARTIGAGQVITESDLTQAQLPADSPVAVGGLSPTAVVGRITLGELAAGEVIRAGDLVADRAQRAGSGRVAMPLALASPTALPFLTPGILVDVVWTPTGIGSAGGDGGRGGVAGAEPNVLARGVRVLVVEQPEDDGGILDTSGSGATILVEAARDDAVALAEAQHSGALSLILP